MFEIDRVSSGVERSTEAFMERATFFLRCQFALIVLFWTAVWAVKISILMFYKDLFHRLPRQKRYWWLVCAYVGLSYLACWGTQLASCWPIEDYFTLGIHLEVAKLPSSQYQENVIRQEIQRLQTTASTLPQLWTFLVTL